MKVKLIDGPKSYYAPFPDEEVYATNKKPVIEVSEAVAEILIETGFFNACDEADEVKPTPEQPEQENDNGDEADEVKLSVGEIDFDELASKTINDLKEFADENGIDVSGLTKKADILEAISVALGGSQTMLDLQGN